MKLEINGIEIDCIIGERPDEREREQRLVVDLSLDVEPEVAHTDSLADAVDYAAVAEAVRGRLVAAKCRMIEAAARVAAEAAAAFKRVLFVRARVVKAGAVAGVGSASTEYLAGPRSTAQRQAETLVALLAASSRTCAAAESCTGGGVGAAITSVPGSSAVFAGGVVSYSNEVKANVLGVKRETLEEFGAVSAECAAEMADGVRRLAKADLAVSVTGIAGPGGGSAEKPVGLVWFGLSSAFAPTRTERAIFPGDRAAVRAQAVIHAIGMLSANA